MLLSDILRLKFPNADFLKDIILQDDGNGVYIKEWNLDTPLPTNEDLRNWALDLDLLYRQKLAVSKRIYPSMAAQLDMLYHDSVNNTTTWQDTIAAIKAAHPKPKE